MLVSDALSCKKKEQKTSGGLRCLEIEQDRNSTDCLRKKHCNKNQNIKKSERPWENQKQFWGSLGEGVGSSQESLRTQWVLFFLCSLFVFSTVLQLSKGQCNSTQLKSRYRKHKRPIAVPSVFCFNFGRVFHGSSLVGMYRVFTYVYTHLAKSV